MKEYTETDPKRIEELLAVPIGAETLSAEHLEQFKKSGLRVVAYELEDIPRLINSELTLIIRLTPTDAEGGKTWYCFTPEAQERWDSNSKALEFKYWRLIDEKLASKRQYFLKQLDRSPNRLETIADRIRESEWRLNPDNDPTAPKVLGINPNSHLKEAWIRLKRGGRVFDTDFHLHWQIMADVEYKFLEWLKELQKNDGTDAEKEQDENRVHLIKGDKQVMTWWDFLNEAGIVDAIKQKGAFNPIHSFELLKTIKLEQYEKARQSFVEERELNKLETGKFEFDSHYISWLNHELKKVEKWLSDTFPNGNKRLKKSNSTQIELRKYQAFVNDEIAKTSTAPQESKGGTGAENEPNTIEVHVRTALEPLRLKAFRNVGEFEKAVSRLCDYFNETTEANASQIWIAKGNKINLAKALGRIYRKRENTKPLDWGYQRAVTTMFDCFSNEDLEGKDGKGFSSTRMFNYMTRGANEMN